MAKMINRVVIQGFVEPGYQGRDAVSVNKYDSGKTKVEFTIKQTNEEGKFPRWFECVLWSDGPINPNYGCGDMILVTGHLDFKTWPDQNTGKTMRKMIIVPTKIQHATMDGKALEIQPAHSELNTPANEMIQNHDIPPLGGVDEMGRPI